MRLTSFTLLLLNIKNGTSRSYYFSKNIIKCLIISLIIISFCQTIFFWNYYKNKMELQKLKLTRESLLKKNAILSLDGKGGIELASSKNSDVNLLNKYLYKTAWTNKEPWKRHDIYIDDTINLINFLGKKDITFNSIPVVWPIKGRLTSDFGYRISPFSGRITFHKGLDISQETGLPVRVTADGVVSFAGSDKDYGKVVIVDHGYGFQTLYAHNSFLFVKEGQNVKRNEIISLLGNTGMSTAPHLHYEVRVNGEAENPLLFILE